MTAELIGAADPEAAAFFADARAALNPPPAPPAPPKPVFSLPLDWPITPRHEGATLTPAGLFAAGGHALRVSYDWIGGRRAMWVGRWRNGAWSILQGYEERPASLLTSPRSWDGCVRQMGDYLASGRTHEGRNLTVDAWLPEFTLVCLTHRDECDSHDSGHNFVQRRTLSRFPEGAYRPCGGCSRDGAYRYTFQIDGRRRGRYGCARHHSGLLDRYLAEADGTVTVQRIEVTLARREAS